jgi:hypothetical protein
VEGDDERSSADLTVRIVCEGDARAERKADARGGRTEVCKKVLTGFFSPLHTF